MKIQYGIIKQAIYDTIISEPNNRFIFNHGDRYVNQVLKERWMSSGPFPCMMIYKSRKTERHEVLGYAPTPYIYYNVRITDKIPNSQETSALMSALGLSGTSIANFNTSEDALDLILTTLEEWLRGDNTSIGQDRRCLGIPQYVGICLPTDVNWGRDDLQNDHFNWVDLTLEIRFQKLTI